MLSAVSGRVHILKSPLLRQLEGVGRAETMSAISNHSHIDQGRSLQVLSLTPFFPSDRDDASGCFISEPLDLLAKAGIHNTVFAVQPAYRPRLRARASVVPVHWLRYWALPGGMGLPSAGAFLFARIVARVRELNRVQPIDLIHAHAPLPCGHAAMLLSRELNIPYVVSVHGLDAFSTEHVTGKSGEWCRRISQRVYRSASQVICVSEHVREQVLAGAGGNCRTAVVYNSVDAALFTPASEMTAALSDASSLMILSIGNLIPIKGHEQLIRAAAALASDFPSLRWEIIGDGPERRRLQVLANELHVADRVRFLGRQSRIQVADALQRCTIFVLPSRYEALGCVYLEAMSTGKPAIGCRNQGIAEVIQHGWNGLLVGPDNHEELTQAISTLLRDEPARRKMGTAARNTILDGFTLAHQSENLARVYRECVA
jgi:teichuronic acid biosynthesis glycosyltransferase TuaC